MTASRLGVDVLLRDASFGDIGDRLMADLPSDDRGGTGGLGFRAVSFVDIGNKSLIRVHCY